MTDLVLTDRAALAVLDEIEQALVAVDSPEDADELWRKIRVVEEAARLARIAEATVEAYARVRLRAKRRWGELLGPAAHGGDRRSDQVTNGHLKSDPEKKQAERARKLAEIPAEDFAKALEGELPSEAAILRLVKHGGALFLPEFQHFPLQLLAFWAAHGLSGLVEPPTTRSA